MFDLLYADELVIICESEEALEEGATQDLAHACSYIIIR